MSTGKKHKNNGDEWGSEVFSSHGTSSARGIKDNINFNVHGKRKDENGCILIQDRETNELRFSLANIYALNDPSFYI